MRALPCLFALGSLLCPAGGARADSTEPTVAIAAVAFQGKIPAQTGGRFLALLGEQLARAGFSLLDPRRADLLLAERPGLIAGCHEEARRDRCLAAQAGILGVMRIILPRLQVMDGGLGLALTLFEITPAASEESPRVDRLVESMELCGSCLGAAGGIALPIAVDRVARGLRAGLDRLLQARLEVTTSPALARVLIDGRELGRGSISADLAPGEHVVLAEAGGVRSERRVTLGPRERRRIELVLPSLEVPGRAAPRPLAVGKWVLAGLGLAALVVGTALWVVDDRPTCDLGPGQRQCPELLDTLGAGVGLFTVGAAALGSSAVLFGIDSRRGQARDGGKSAMLPWGGGF